MRQKVKNMRRIHREKRPRHDEDMSGDDEGSNLPPKRTKQQKSRQRADCTCDSQVDDDVSFGKFVLCFNDGFLSRARVTWEGYGNRRVSSFVCLSVTFNS